MNNNDAFFKTKELGDLYYKDTLLYYEIPRAFILKTLTNNDLYLCYEMESAGSYDKWLTAAISNDDYWQIMNHEKPLQQIYFEKPAQDLMTITNQYLMDGDLTTVTRDGQGWLNKLPKEAVYAEC